MNHKTLLSLTVIMLTMMSFGLSASITNRAAADNLVLQLFSDELTDINVYARKTALFDVSHSSCTVTWIRYLCHSMDAICIS